jgi:hypothetical protein
MDINGKPVVNGKRKWMLSIDDGDIAGGKRKGPGQCAAARAILRENVDVRGVRVHIGRIFVEYDKHWERYATPSSLRSEVIAFDRGGTFMPGVHSVRPISPSSVRALEEHAKRKTAKTLPRKAKAKTARKKIARAKQYNIYGVRARGATR